MKSLYRRIAGADVQRMLSVLTVLIESEDGTVEKHQRSFGGFKRDRQALVTWLLELAVELVLMESTGSYWNRPGFPPTGSTPAMPATSPDAKPPCPMPNGWPNWGGSAWSSRASSCPKTSGNCAGCRAIARNSRTSWPGKRTAYTRSSTMPESNSARWLRIATAFRHRP